VIAISLARAMKTSGEAIIVPGMER